MTDRDWVVRPAGPGDVEALVGLLGELFALERDYTVDPARQRDGLTRLLARDRDARVLVAEAGGRVVGMCSVQLVISTAEGGPAGWVEDVVVTEGHRGLGLGSALLEAAAAWAAEQGARRLQLLADGGNAPALGFYAARGWARTELICLRQRVSAVTKT